MGTRNRARDSGDSPPVTFAHRLEYVLVQAGVFALLCTDVRGAARLGSFLRRPVGLVGRPHRRVAEDSLRRAWGAAMAPAAAERTALRVYEGLGVTAAEFIHGPRRIRGRASRKWFRVEAPEEVFAAARGGPFILL